MFFARLADIFTKFAVQNIHRYEYNLDCSADIDAADV